MEASLTQLEEKVLRAIDPAEAVGFVQSMVRIPSHSECPGQEKEVAEFICSRLERAGVEASLEEVVDGRPNALGRLRGKGGGKSLLLTGHIDTVPPLGMADPYSGDIRDGRMYGRGVADMKAGIGAMAYALTVLGKMGLELDGDLLLLGAVDEESNSSLGTRKWVADGHRADMAIMGEPTSLEVVAAHNAIDWFQIDIQGHTAHSSVPHTGNNAIYKAARIVEAIQGELVPVLSQRLHRLTGPSTVSVGQIIGGCDSGIAQLKSDAELKFTGIVPDKCTVYLDRRWTPDERLEDVYRELVELVEQVNKKDLRCAIRVRQMLFSAKYPHPPAYVEDSHPMVEALCSLRERITGRPARPMGVQYWSDAGILQGEAGIPTVLFGPGSIEQGHAPIEYTSVDEIVAAARIYALAAVRLCVCVKEYR